MQQLLQKYKKFENTNTFAFTENNHSFVTLNQFFKDFVMCQLIIKSLLNAKFKTPTIITAKQIIIISN